jgi:hypothetical protein
MRTIFAFIYGNSFFVASPYEIVVSLSRSYENPSMVNFVLHLIDVKVAQA